MTPKPIADVPDSPHPSRTARTPSTRSLALREFFDEPAEGGAGAETPRDRAPGATGATPDSVLRCSSTADFLAALPALTGFTAQNSLFVVIFDGRRSNRALRIDLPESEAPAHCGTFLDALCQMLGAVGGPSGPALVIVSTRSFAESGGAPWRRLAKRIERRLTREGFRPRELACVAPDGWVSFLDPSAPRSGRPLSEITESPIAREAASFVPVAPVDLDAVGRLPEPDPDRALRVSRALEAFRESGADHAAVEQLRLAAENAGRAFSGRTPADPTQGWAQLARDAQHADCWLVLALTALTRAKFVASLVDDPEITMFADLQQEPGDEQRGPRSGTETLRRLLYSLAHEAPEREKLDRAITAWEQAAAHSPREYRPGLLALLAWAWWLIGLQSVSARLVDQALEIDPHHELTLMVDRLTDSIPAWYLQEQVAA